MVLRPSLFLPAAISRRRFGIHCRYACIRHDDYGPFDLGAETKTPGGPGHPLQKRSTRKISQGEAIGALADFALQNRVLLAADAKDMRQALEDDPFYDLSIVFDLGPTDARTLDRLLYGRR